MFELALVALLILANGVFATAEMALVSSNQGRLERLASEGDRGARRAAELAAAEVQGFQEDQADLAREQADGVDACRVAVERATAVLAATREMEERVRAAEHAARQGLDVMVTKLSSEG